MGEKAKYCKCKNTYTINNCDNSCNAQYYWEHGVGKITSTPIVLGGIFDETFDNKFN